VGLAQLSDRFISAVSAREGPQSSCQSACAGKGRWHPGTHTHIDRDFPHQVVIRADHYSGSSYRTVQHFCVGLSLAPRNHSVVIDDRWHVVFCFSDKADAEKFKLRFGGEPLKSCTMIITEPNKFVADVHDRMPVLLQPKQFDGWLSGKAGKETLVPAPEKRLQKWPVSKRVNAGEVFGTHRQGLAEESFVEDRNVRIDYRWAEGRSDALPGLATSSRPGTTAGASRAVTTITQRALTPSPQP